jgi:hypothetical protein
VLPTPQPVVEVKRTLAFPTPGVYELTLRASSQRNGASELFTNMQNLARVQVVVH